MDNGKLNKIRALLAKAESTTFPEEAEAFSDKAMELMAQYGIDDAMLAASGHSQDEIVPKTIEIRNPYSGIKAQLLFSIARANSCQAIAHPDRSKQSYSRSTLVGHASDVERVEMLYTSLLVQATGQLINVRPVFRSDTTSSFRKAWFVGFVDAVYDRLDEIMRRATAAADTTTPGTALVLVSRDDKVTELFKKMFTDTSKISSPRLVDAEAYNGGQAAGSRADLGQDRVDGRRRSLAG